MLETILKNVTQKAKGILARGALATTLAIFPISCQPEETTCYTDTDCAGEQICENNTCISDFCAHDYDCPGEQICDLRKCVEPEEPLVYANKRTTTASGNVTFFSRSGQEIIVTVKNSEGSRLEDITVHYLNKGRENLVLAVDRQGNYYPEIEQFTTSSRSSALKQDSLELQTFALSGEEVTILLDVVKPAYKIVTEDMRMEGNLLEQDENYNKYCMTLDQISKGISVPLGVMFLAAESAGFGPLTKVIKLATVTPLVYIHDMYIRDKYGTHDSYEVWAPKTAMSICGEEFEGAVCDINDGQLSRLWDPDLPFWQIRGPCERQQPTEGEGPGPSSQCDDPNYLFCDDFNRELSTEKWVLEAGVSYSVSDEGILLSRALATKPLRECPSGNFEVSFRVRFPGAFLSRDDFMLSLTAAYEELITSIHTQRFNSSSRMYLVCDFAAGGEAGIPEVRGPDPTEWATVRFQKNGEAFSLYVNDALKGSNRCTAQRPGISSLVFNAYDQTELDYVRVACK